MTYKDIRTGDHVKVVQDLPGGATVVRAPHLTVVNVSSRFISLNNGEKYSARHGHKSGVRPERHVGLSFVPRIEKL